ncbi:Sec-independent protein translocase protein TatB [Gammaproteobacteria bacterium]|nr:Sec-independent protein translocase protein TatB [Gammaproteobacteria bacterium]MDB4252833.1 Sec-independent protein translocase protein TatB [Gammaproteobacteria bacterium]
MFQIGFFEILLILSLGLVIIGPDKLPEVIKFFLKYYKKLQKNVSNFQNDIEKEIDTKEIKQDIYNELRMEELEQSELFKDEKKDD